MVKQVVQNVTTVIENKTEIDDVKSYEMSFNGSKHCKN